MLKGAVIARKSVDYRQYSSPFIYPWLRINRAYNKIGWGRKVSSANSELVQILRLFTLGEPF